MIIDRFLNRVREQPPYPVSDDIKRLHHDLTIVDLHADPLLWNRDLLARSSYGHIDLNRLVAGNAALQVFGVVTRFPLIRNRKAILLNVDLISPLSVIDRWPRQTRRDVFQRAIYQSRKLDDAVKRSNGKMMLVRSVKDLDHLLALRKDGAGTVGAMLTLEGAQALRGDLSNLRKLYDSSFRMLGIAHFSDNEAGGSAHGPVGYGLTPFGRDMVRMLQDLHMLIDLAHASARTIDDVTEMVKTPVIASHAGVRGTCDNARNLSDSQVKKIAASGGVIGIAMFKTAVCGKRLEDTVRAVRYVADMVGVDYVSIGSDFDGAITAPVDASGLAQLTAELVAGGFDESEIRKIMGGNALRVFRDVLPKE